MHQTEILREIVSCVDTLCGEAFVEHSLIDRTRLQHIKTSLANTNMILTSFRSHTYTCPWRVFISDTVAVSENLKAHNHQCFRTPFASGNRERSHTCNSCAHRPNSRAGRNCGLQRRSRLFAHIHRFKMGIHSLHHKFQNRSFRDFILRNLSKQWNSRASVVAQYSISLQSRRCSGCEPCSHPRPSPLSNFCEFPSVNV